MNEQLWSPAADHTHILWPAAVLLRPEEFFSVKFVAQVSVSSEVNCIENNAIKNFLTLTKMQSLTDNKCESSNLIILMFVKLYEADESEIYTASTNKKFNRSIGSAVRTERRLKNSESRTGWGRALCALIGEESCGRRKRRPGHTSCSQRSVENAEPRRSGSVDSSRLCCCSDSRKVASSSSSAAFSKIVSPCGPVDAALVGDCVRMASRALSDGANVLPLVCWPNWVCAAGWEPDSSEENVCGACRSRGAHSGAGECDLLVEEA